MAVLKSVATGNWSSASSWVTVDATASQTVATSLTVSATTYKYSPAWTESSASVVNGVVIAVSTVTAVGTLTVGIFTGAGTTPLASVTVNVSDLLPSHSNSLKFTSTVALSNASTYRIGFLTSVTGNVILFGNTTTGDIYKYVWTTTTSALSTGDTPLIIQDLTGAGAKTTYTITMDSVSNTTIYGAIIIYNGGTLNYGIAASTNYYLKTSGLITVDYGGTFTIGTVTNPIPSTSTAKLEFTTANTGVTVNTNGTFTTYGNTKTLTSKLAADISIGATTATTSTSTGWNSGDQIVIPSTTRTFTDAELVTLSGNASGTSIAFNACAAAHGGNATTGVQADIINLTLNIQIFGQGSGSTITAGISIISLGGSIISMFYTQVYYGASTMISIQGASPSVNIQFCSIAFTTIYIIGIGSVTGSPTITISNNVLYFSPNYGIFLNYLPVMTSTNTTINNNIFIRAYNLINRTNITYQNNIHTSSNNNGLQLGEPILSAGATGYIAPGSITNITSYSHAGYGLYLPNTLLLYGTITTITAWRNGSYGIALNLSPPSSASLILDTINLFGNSNANINLTSAGNIWIKSLTSNGGTTLVAPFGISLLSSDKTVFYGASFGQTTTHATSDLAGYQTSVSTLSVLFYNTVFSATPMSNQSYLGSRTTAYSVSSMNHNNNSGIHKCWQQTGTIDTDTTIYNSTPISMRMTPISTSFKLQSYPVRLSMNGGDTATIQVSIRRSVVGDGTAYNGNAPRIVALFNPMNNQTDISVVATSVGAAGSWETLSGTFTATNSGVFEFAVDCDGTTGWINVDDWKTTYYKQTNKMDYWLNGNPYIDISSSVRELSSTFIS